MRLPTSVEPVKAILSTPGARRSRGRRRVLAATMLTTPAGSSTSCRISASASAVSGVVSAGLRTQVLPQASAGRELPRRHQEREVPGDDLAADADRRRARAAREMRCRVAQLVAPARVVEEVLGDERQVHVAALADGLAAVHRLEHGEFSGPILDPPRDAEEVLGPFGGLGPLPAPKGRPGRRDRPVHIGRRALGDLGERLLGRGIHGREAPPPLRGDEAAVDEVVVGRANGRPDRLRSGGVGPVDGRRRSHDRSLPASDRATAPKRAS
jgi:hypothetical protein